VAEREALFEDHIYELGKSDEKRKKEGEGKFASLLQDLGINSSSRWIDEEVVILLKSPFSPSFCVFKIFFLDI